MRDYRYRLTLPQREKLYALYHGDTLLCIPHLYSLTDQHTKEEALSNAESLLYSLVCQTIEPYLLK